MSSFPGDVRVEWFEGATNPYALKFEEELINTILYGTSHPEAPVLPESDDYALVHGNHNGMSFPSNRR